MPFVKVNGAKLYYEDTEDGSETIVMTHNLMFSCRMFDDQINALKSQYRCVAYDFRGQGRSEVTESGYDMDSLTQDAAELIKKLGCTPCHFVGFSMGGFIGIRLAARQPELLQSLVLASTSAEAQPREIFPWHRLLNFLARWIGLWSVASPVMRLMFSERFLTDPGMSDARKLWRRRLLDNDPIGITRAVTGMFRREGVDDLLDRIRVPTLITYSENDLEGIEQSSIHLHECIDNSKLVVIPNAGHTSPVEDPGVVTRVLMEFIGNLQR